MIKNEIEAGLKKAFSLSMDKEPKTPFIELVKIWSDVFLSKLNDNEKNAVKVRDAFHIYLTDNVRFPLPKNILDCLPIKENYQKMLEAPPLTDDEKKYNQSAFKICLFKASNKDFRNEFNKLSKKRPDLSFVDVGRTVLKENDNLSLDAKRFFNSQLGTNEIKHITDIM